MGALPFNLHRRIALKLAWANYLLIKNSTWPLCALSYGSCGRMALYTDSNASFFPGKKILAGALVILLAYIDCHLQHIPLIDLLELRLE